MKNGFIIAVIAFIFIFALADKCDRKMRNEAQIEANKPKEKISCIVCGKDLTDDYNRIRPNGKEYFCTPCYKQTMRDVNENIQAQGYD